MFAKSISRATAVACVITAVIALAPVARAHGLVPRSNLSYEIVGGDFTYTVRPGDSLDLIGARFGVAPPVIASMNGIAPNAIIRTGQHLRIDDRHIVPAVTADGILINVPQRMLFLFSNGDLLDAYPVAVGRPSVKWRTPITAFKVLAMEQNPIWWAPKSIQEEMKQEGGPVITYIAAGPRNPLGPVLLKLSLPDDDLHGTSRPASIYSFQSHGCIRLMPRNAKALYGWARVGMAGRVIYQPVLMALSPDGRIFAEVNLDVYKMRGDPFAELRKLADSHKLSNMIDWSAARTVAERHEGIARDITGEKAPARGGANEPAPSGREPFGKND